MSSFFLFNFVIIFSKNKKKMLKNLSSKFLFAFILNLFLQTNQLNLSKRINKDDQFKTKNYQPEQIHLSYGGKF